MIRELQPRFTGLPLFRMCQLLEVPRSLVYRKPVERPERTKFYQDLKIEIASVLTLHPGYGYRRVRRELGKRRFPCGYKSVTRAMREEGLQFKKKKKFRPRTSDGKGRGSYSNLLKETTIDGPGQVWVADITYLGLPGGFAYLACVLDVYLRRIVGSAMSVKIDSQLPLAALKNALSNRRPNSGWIHHSDRGSQYLSEDYVKTVLEAEGRISCSDKGSPQDNAFMESFFKTLKTEEVWIQDYRNLPGANESISNYLRYYNSDRMHSSLNYMSPEEFEAQFKDIDQ